MQLKEFYDQIGSRYEDVLSRIPSEGILKKFIHKFVNNPSYNELKAALNAADWSVAFSAVHTLKGVAQNLGLDRLGNAASQLTEAMRDKAEAPDAALVSAVDTAYEEVVAMIPQLDA